MYVHGFGSSAQSGTVKRLRNLFPNAEVIARDMPIHPAEALALLHRLCEEEKPDLIIGTSMGGMYTEQLYGFDRILINPAFQMGDTMQEHGLTGKVTFLNPREDGATEFLCNKALVAEYREATTLCFEHADDEGEDGRVYGLFGDKDELVHTFDLFRSHYSKAIHFHGEHRLNDHALLHAVAPVVRWIDDRQEGRERPIVFIAVEDTLKAGDSPAPSAQKAFRMLIENYDVYLVADSVSSDPQRQTDVMRWVEEYFSVPAYDRLIFINQKQLLYGDYLIDSRRSGFMGALLKYGEDPLKTWDDVIVFFERLGGQ